MLYMYIQSNNGSQLKRLSRVIIGQPSSQQIHTVNGYSIAIYGNDDGTWRRFRNYELPGHQSTTQPYQYTNRIVLMLSAPPPAAFTRPDTVRVTHTHCCAPDLSPPFTVGEIILCMTLSQHSRELLLILWVIAQSTAINDYCIRMNWLALSCRDRIRKCGSVILSVYGRPPTPTRSHRN